ncbi:MAG: hypothetical protein AB7O57_09285 [Hyphomicrobiaceae bacterium]
MKFSNGHVTIAAAALGAGAVALHHIHEGAMDPTVAALATSETARGIAFGAGGGAAVGVVTRSSVAEILGRIFVGGLMAAVAAPWMAETILKVPTSSSSYPVLCCSIGVLGYQIVHQVIKDPSSLPVIGRVLGPLAAPAASPASPAATGGQSPLPGPTIAPEPIRPPAASPAPSAGQPMDAPASWPATVAPASPPRPIRVPLAR